MSEYFAVVHLPRFQAAKQSHNRVDLFLVAGIAQIQLFFLLDPRKIYPQGDVIQMPGKYWGDGIRRAPHDCVGDRVHSDSAVDVYQYQLIGSS